HHLTARRASASVSLLIPRPPTSTLFPYTTLFRSNAHPQFRNRREQNRGIQVALHSRAIADIHPRLIDVDAPVDSHHVAAGSVQLDRKSTRLNSSHVSISYAVFCLKKKRFKKIPLS